jgi:hypothetical protein
MERGGGSLIYDLRHIYLKGLYVRADGTLRADAPFGSEAPFGF